MANACWNVDGCWFNPARTKFVPTEINYCINGETAAFILAPGMGRSWVVRSKDDERREATFHKALARAERIVADMLMQGAIVRNLGASPYYYAQFPIGARPTVEELGEQILRRYRDPRTRGMSIGTVPQEFYEAVCR